MLDEMYSIACFDDIVNVDVIEYIGSGVRENAISLREKKKRK